MRVVVRKTFFVVYVTGGIPFANLLVVLLSITISSFVWQVLGVMSVHEFIQSRKRINYHTDIVLRTPSISIGERMLIFSFKALLRVI